MADVIRENDEVVSGIEQLSRAEELPGKLRPEELSAGASRTMHDQNGVDDLPGAIPSNAPEGPVMKPEFRQGLATREMEVVYHEILSRGDLGPGATRTGDRRRDPAGHPTPHHCHASRSSVPFPNAMLFFFRYPSYSRDGPLASVRRPAPTLSLFWRDLRFL
jgi:hypothetical protein